MFKGRISKIVLYLLFKASLIVGLAKFCFNLSHLITYVEYTEVMDLIILLLYEYIYYYYSILIPVFFDYLLAFHYQMKI